jgi:hypothetical protein
MPAWWEDGTDLHAARCFSLNASNQLRHFIPNGCLYRHRANESLHCVSLLRSREICRCGEQGHLPLVAVRQRIFAPFQLIRLGISSRNNHLGLARVALWSFRNGAASLLERLSQAVSRLIPRPVDKAGRPSQRRVR